MLFMGVWSEFDLLHIYVVAMGTDLVYEVIYQQRYSKQKSSGKNNMLGRRIIRKLIPLVEG